jgi:hypothetical protein
MESSKEQSIKANYGVLYSKTPIHDSKQAVMAHTVKRQRDGM